jgi:predicted Zn-dependent protease with MMP-like domain
VEGASIEPGDKEGPIIGERHIDIYRCYAGDSGAQGEPPGALVLGLHGEKLAHSGFRPTVDPAIEQLGRRSSNEKLTLIHQSLGHHAKDDASGQNGPFGSAEQADNGSMTKEVEPPVESPAEQDPSDPFEDLVFAALDSLPQEFKDRLGSVAIVVEDEASPEQLHAVGAPDLFGLYTGVPRTAYGADEAPFASKITVFRGPHLRHYRDPQSLANGVTDTVYHEVAHHFGISDARLEEMARERAHRH